MARHDKMTQGGQANDNGSAYELVIAGTLQRRKYTPLQRSKSRSKVAQADFDALVERLHATGQPYYRTQFKSGHRSLYGLEQTADFWLWHPAKFPHGAIIEVKYQSENGSVDEKYPFTVQSLRLAGLPVFLVLGGGGAKPEAIDWCVGQEGDGLTVFRDWSAFDVAANRGMFG
jgi:hypothetical protein